MKIEIPDGAMLLEPRETYDRALKGFTTKVPGQKRPSTTPVAIYSTRKCIEAIMQDNDWSYDDAAEWFDFNVLGSWRGECTPIFHK